MALIPLKQTINLYKAVGHDEWGVMVYAEPIAMKCRVDESTELLDTSGESTGLTMHEVGGEKSNALSIMFNRYPDISYDDYIEYVNEFGIAIKRKPTKIEPIRLINGKVTLTVVSL